MKISLSQLWPVIEMFLCLMLLLFWWQLKQAKQINKVLLTDVSFSQYSLYSSNSNNWFFSSAPYIYMCVCARLSDIFKLYTYIYLYYLRIAILYWIRALIRMIQTTGWLSILAYIMILSLDAQMEFVVSLLYVCNLTSLIFTEKLNQSLPLAWVTIGVLQVLEHYSHLVCGFY